MAHALVERLLNCLFQSKPRSPWTFPKGQKTPLRVSRDYYNSIKLDLAAGSCSKNTVKGHFCEIGFHEASTINCNLLGGYAMRRERNSATSNYSPIST
jgi:hypothetical protein